MSLPNNTVRMAVATAMATFAASGAHALDISTYNASTAVNVYVSGSTAVDNTLVNTAIETDAPGGLCQAGTIDIYYIGTTSSYSNRMIFCSASANTGLGAGTPLAIYKESTAGSANGVTPLIAAAKGGSSGLSFINPTTLKASGDSACTTTSVSSTSSTSAYTNHASCPSADVQTNVVPTGGFADVEAAILRSVTNATISATDAATYLTATPSIDQVWALLISKQAYYALQAAEGLANKCASNDDPHCAPTLSKTQVSGMLDGDIYSWAQLGLNNTVGNDNNIYLCRRDYASGTEASWEAYFLGARCSKASEAMQGEDGQYVWAAGSGGGVRTCMQTFQNGGKLTSYYNQDGTYTSGGATNPYTATENGNQWAIGLNNTEITASNLSNASDSFRIVAIDGVLPQLANVQNGFWPYFSTGNAYQIKSGNGVPSGPALTAWNAIKQYIGHPVFTADSNKNYTGNVWGPSGDMSPASYASQGYAPTLPATDTAAETNPTNAYEKTYSSVINNCDVPQFDAADNSEGTPAETNLLGTSVVNPD